MYLIKIICKQTIEIYAYSLKSYNLPIDFLQTFPAFFLVFIELAATLTCHVRDLYIEQSTCFTKIFAASRGIPCKMVLNGAFIKVIFEA